MTSGAALDWIRDMLYTGLIAGTPIVLTVTVIGLALAVVQAATQINEAAVPFAAKTVGVFIALVLSGSFMITELREFTVRAFEAIARVTG